MSCVWGLEDGLGRRRCEGGWVWAPDQVWGDGGVSDGCWRCDGTDSRSGAGMTRGRGGGAESAVGAGRVEIPAASAGMMEKGAAGVTGCRDRLGVWLLLRRFR